jgi:predicted RNA-binding protein with PIN domain
MKSTKNIIVNGNNITVNTSDMDCEWIMVHDGTKVLCCHKMLSSGSGILETIHTIYEGNSKEQCKNEALRLNLSDFPE